MKSHLIFSIKALGLGPKDMSTESAVAGWEGSRRIQRVGVGEDAQSPHWEMSAGSGAESVGFKRTKWKSVGSEAMVQGEELFYTSNSIQKKTSEAWEMGCFCVHGALEMAQKTHLGMALWRGTDDRGHLCNFILESEIDRRASCMLSMCSTTQVHSWLSSELFMTFVNALPHFKKRK